jgi:predicted O-methyltransferase YrrM
VSLSPKQLLRRLLLGIARSSMGERMIASVLVHEPQLAVRPLRMATAGRSRFARVDAWPERLDGFEDLAFLFTSTPLNMGIVSMTIGEGAYLFGLVRRLGPGTVVEIGRYQGGSTVIAAAALAPGGRLYSYDTHGRRTDDYTGSDMDAALSDTLRRYGRADNVVLLVEDSATTEVPGPCDLILVDGDHTYRGVRADYEHWRPHLRAGGHLLLHDAVRNGRLSTGEESVARLVAEIERDDAVYFERRQGVDSFAHFVRTGVPAPFDA